MPAYQDKTGQVFGRLTVLSDMGVKKDKRYWKCRCSCGSIYITTGSALVTGRTKSCGCLHRELNAFVSQNKLKLKIGTRFGKLVVVEEVPHKPRRHRNFRCVCDCGTQDYITQGVRLLKKATDSCGCLFRERIGAVNRRHGMTGTREYNTWRSMVQRCYYKKHKSYADYGGRGIKICKRWLGKSGFDHFFSDKGKRPLDCTLGRINNDGNYTPQNTRWETHVQQCSNRRKPKKRK